ncbi:mycothiol transferase [Saccharopolyspora sp. 5N708]|uniref:mycothiol transferase n=1 Tax=Saccharopolyspora sp. 5N708 TaxID=3457424 RepID=UPI003FD2D43D
MRHRRPCRPCRSRGAGGGDHHGSRPSLRWVLCHLIEEYARHNGHADVLRESVDGSTGE